MTDEATARRLWNDAADAYHHFIETGLDYYRTELHGPALLDACGDVRGLRVLDLGCGQGWFSRQLAGAGGHVTGIDWSAGLIEHARRLEEARHFQAQPSSTTHGGVTYDVLDAADLAARFAPGTFDLVTACMSLMDMPHPASVLAAAARLAPRLVFSIPNPVTDAPHRVWKRDADGHKLALELDRYFEATPTVLQWNMQRLLHHFTTIQYRYTLEQWSRMLEDANLTIARLREPRPTPSAIAALPDLADAARLPYVLIIDARSHPR
ncbi:MAG: methyltransferase domain-containing protein [Deltaproteobacteria bacterium]|nr:methyltransferase domain-containing protein [Deltaproteobacteria bacterium]